MRVLALAAAAVVLGSLPQARAQDDEPAKPPPDTGIPGPPVAYAMRPSLARETKACSMRLPVCVHAGDKSTSRTVLDVLAAAERAWETLMGAFRLHPPDLDDDLTYPIYLVDHATTRTRVLARDVRSRIDRARTMTVFDAHAVASGGCAADALVAREIVRAFLFRVAPATAESVAEAQATYLAQLIVPCALALTPSETEGTPLFADPLFWRRIDWAYGRGPGSIVTASWALAPTMTAIGASRWHDEPDAFDVLRVSFKGALSTGSTLDDLLLDTAIARAFAGSADDGLHQPETRTLGDAARVTVDWDLPWPTRPKRVAPRTPVYPTSASYLVIHRAGAEKGARLRVEIVWEEHALFRWAFVKLDAGGRELGRVAIPARERATEAQMTLVDIDAVDTIMLVGVNVGDPAYRFDPDDEVWEPHSWLVTLAEERP